MIMMIQKEKPFRSKAYLDAVRSLPCVITGEMGVCDPHHIIGHGGRGMSQKVSDLWVFPLHWELHKQLHDHGWQTWEDEFGCQKMFALRTINLLIMEKGFRL